MPLTSKLKQTEQTILLRKQSSIEGNMLSNSLQNCSQWYYHQIAWVLTTSQREIYGNILSPHQEVLVLLFFYTTYSYESIGVLGRHLPVCIWCRSMQNGGTIFVLYPLRQIMMGDFSH